MKFLITGAAGFIGFHVSLKLLNLGHEVVGIDNINDYYDVKLKTSRLDILRSYKNFIFHKINIQNKSEVEGLFKQNVFDRIIHLAAQAGVRYSLDNPMAYAESNLIGHLNLLEVCRSHNVKHLLYASSSSLYGLNKKVPFSTSDRVDHPISLYAATKKANELMSHTYSHLFQLPTTGLRFFTVYGPWGRPDMALFKFTRAILEGNPIEIYNEGLMSRDFTYIDDIVESIVRLQDVIPHSDAGWTVETGSPAASSAPYKVYNIGNGKPIQLLEFVKCLESVLNIKAIKKFLPMQPGDVAVTCADSDDLFRVTNFRPQTDIFTGVESFVKWFRHFYKI